MALLLDEKSSLTPDQVKGLLMSTARPLAADRSAVQGAGVVDVTAALDHLEAKRALPVAASATLPRSTGLGSLEASRGGEHVLDPTTGAVLTGEVDALGRPVVAGHLGHGPEDLGRDVDGRHVQRAHLGRLQVVAQEAAAGRVVGALLERRRVGPARLVRRPVGGPDVARELLEGPHVAR